MNTIYLLQVPERDPMASIYVIIAVIALILFVAMLLAILKIPKVARANEALMKLEALKALREGANSSAVQSILLAGTNYDTTDVEALLKQGLADRQSNANV